MPPPLRKRGRGVRPWLIQAKFVGLVGCLGGLAALTALGVFARAPGDRAGWLLLRDVMRSIFWPCFFGGLVLTIVAGVALWSRHPREFSRMRWLRVKAAALVIILPTLHITARGRVTEFYQAVETGDLADLPRLWARVTHAFGAGLVIMLLLAAFARIKPRLGQRVGARGGRE